MPPKHPRKPEFDIAEDAESGFIASIYDGEYLIQIRPEENGYRVNLASKSGLGDATFLRTYGREERFRRLLETEFDAIDADAVFGILEEHFDDEYRIVNLKKGVKLGNRRGAKLYVETGETIPMLANTRDYRDDQWSKEASYRLMVWPNDDQYIEIKDAESGKLIADYRPNSLLEDIRNEASDDHEREHGPISVPGVHAPISVRNLENAPVVHTHIECSHLEQLGPTEFNPAGDAPPRVPADGSGELPLRWCSRCASTEPTPDKIRERYSPESDSQ